MQNKTQVKIALKNSLNTLRQVFRKALKSDGTFDTELLKQELPNALKKALEQSKEYVEAVPPLRVVNLTVAMLTKNGVSPGKYQIVSYDKQNDVFVLKELENDRVIEVKNVDKILPKYLKPDVILEWNGETVRFRNYINPIKWTKVLALVIGSSFIAQVIDTVIEKLYNLYLADKEKISTAAGVVINIVTLLTYYIAISVVLQLMAGYKNPIINIFNPEFKERMRKIFKSLSLPSKIFLALLLLSLATSPTIPLSLKKELDEVAKDIKKEIESEPVNK